MSSSGVHSQGTLFHYLFELDTVLISGQLPDDFADFYTNLTGHGPTAEVLAHCRRELMHGVWDKILDEDFMEAYEHGIVLECHDGVSRRFYPRIFTYSADYPEKYVVNISLTRVLDSFAEFSWPAFGIWAIFPAHGVKSRRIRSQASAPRSTTETAPSNSAKIPHPIVYGSMRLAGESMSSGIPSRAPESRES